MHKMNSSKKSVEIEAQIRAYGYPLFQAVRDVILQKATIDTNPEKHAFNKNKLLEKMEETVQLGTWNGQLSNDEFWRRAWGRVVYSGTKASKASLEIESMAHYPMFENFNDVSLADYAFDKSEWETFSQYWKRRSFWYARARVSAKKRRKPISSLALNETTADLTKNQRKQSLQFSIAETDWKIFLSEWEHHEAGSVVTANLKVSRKLAGAIDLPEPASNWLGYAKRDAKWLDILKASFTTTGPGAVELMTKSGRFDEVRFSADEDKMLKYVKLLRLMQKHAAKGDQVLRYFVRDHDPLDPCSFWQIHENFESEFGTITALHLMMDLGLKTVKPDRVITYLFSELGWLESMQKGTPADIFIKTYVKRSVVMEVVEKANFLAAQFPNDIKNPHRLLDIWFVKYGQDPEPAFGITVNLEEKMPLSALFEEVRARLSTKNDPGMDFPKAA